MSVMVEEEAPRVSLFRAQLRSVLETLLNDAVTEITRVYHVSTSVAVNVFTMEEEDSPQDQSSSPPCKMENLAVLAPVVPASPPPAVSFKKEVLESEPHPPFQQPMIVHVTSLARKDAYSQTDGSCFHLQPSISTTAPLQPPTLTAPLKREVSDVCVSALIDRDQAQRTEPLKREVSDVCVSAPIDRDQAQLPEPLSTNAWDQVSDHAWSKRSRGEVDNMEDDERPSSASKGTADGDQNQVVSREDSQERVATQQETCEQLVLRARTVPRRPNVAKLKPGHDNLLVNGSKINPDQTSQSQTSCLPSASLTQTSECRESSSMSEWNMPIEDKPDEEQPDNIEDEHPPGPSALEGIADTGQTPEQLAKRLKSCVVQLVKVNPFVCQLCSKTFKLQHSLLRHLRFHTGEKPSACKRCGKSFALKGNLKKHYKMVHSRRASALLKPHTCDQCGRTFALQGNLKKHYEIVHSGESPSFRCEFCVRQYCSKSKLAVHVRVHTGEKPHRCIFCKKHYRLKKNMIKHMLKHLGYGPAAEDARQNHNQDPRSSDGSRGGQGGALAPSGRGLAPPKPPPPNKLN